MKTPSSAPVPTPASEAPAAASAKPVRAAERIQRTAADLFYREGIRAVGVDEIVNRAGVTKPSLYRSFGSKDELAAAYLRDYECRFFERFEEAIAADEGDPRAQLITYFTGVANRCAAPNYRGCGMSNAAVEYPRGTDDSAPHPARRVAEDNKREMRRRFREMAAAAGVRDADGLGDALLLMLEGCFVTGQLFEADSGDERPSRAAPAAVRRLIDAYLADSGTAD
ncbi:TetR/AcrR family transcriptional regulator [Bordetella sp. N]|uniref:TetR/AcrR family transcriptional regulator n=1 Tax=Bordetella sp. N TaxID=1746199 RepID=UPI00071016AA|nr:TetR/AcrR family transcriptional regulator [Bordetella sp. N]ALM83703.1 TetR family transcriptional regulator [Bordetella sp. N]